MATADRASLPSSQSPPSRKRGGFEPWPWALAVLLLAMIASSVSLWAIASANPDGLVGDAWEAGLAYNDDLAARRAAESLGVVLEVESRPTADGARISVRLAGPDEPAAQSVTVERIRPAESGYDASYPLRLDAGEWAAEVPLPRPGRWQLRVSAQLGSARLERTLDHWHASAGAAR